ERDGRSVAARIKHVYEFAPPPGRLVGRILTQARDRPIARAEVTLRADDGTEQKVETGEDGAFRFEKIPPGAYRIHIVAPKSLPQDADQLIEPGEEVENVLRLLPDTSVMADEGANAAGTSEAVEEVRVRGQRPAREVTRRTIETREMERIPGTNG